MACRGLFGLIFGHKYRPRFNEEIVPPAELGHFKGTTYGMEMVIDKLTEKKSTYVLDCCERCGRMKKDPGL